MKYPREIAIPNRILCKNKYDFYKHLNSNIRYCNLFTNVYDFTEFDIYRPIYDSAIIDKIYLDLDKYKKNSDGTKTKLDPYSDLMKIHNWCKEKNIQHYMKYSGSGFIVFIMCQKDYPIIHKKEAIINFTNHLIKELDLNSVDKQTVGDLARIYRISNSFNFKPYANRFCIPLNEQLLYSGEKNIRYIAHVQSDLKNTSFNTELFDLTVFDFINGASFEKKNNLTMESIEFHITDEIIKRMPICIQHILNLKEPVWHERFPLITYLRDNQFTYSEALDILRKHLSHKKFIHCVYEEKQVYYLFRNMKYVFPTQMEMKCNGLCPFQENKWCDKSHTACKNYGR